MLTDIISTPPRPYYGVRLSPHGIHPRVHVANGFLPSQQVVFFNIYHPEKLPSVIERFEKEADRVISVLESVLSMQAFLNGDKVTVADLGFISWFVQRRGTRDSLTRANVLLLRALGTSWRTPFSCPRSMSSRPSTRPVRQSFLLPSFALWFHLTDKLLDE